MRSPKIFAVGALLVAMAGISGCAQDASQRSFCEVMNGYLITSQKLFLPNSGALDDVSTLDGKLEAMDKLGDGPSGLDDEFATWRVYLEKVREALAEGDKTAALAAYVDDQATKDAGSALYSAQQDCY